MTHEEKWKRIYEIDAELSDIDAEWRKLVDEKHDLLMMHTPPPAPKGSRPGNFGPLQSLGVPVQSDKP